MGSIEHVVVVVDVVFIFIIEILYKTSPPSPTPTLVFPSLAYYLSSPNQLISSNKRSLDQALRLFILKDGLSRWRRLDISPL